MQAQTIKGTLAAIRDVADMSGTYDYESGEFRVTFRPHEMDSERREDCAYYTNDMTDAVSTAMDMRRREDAREAMAMDEGN